MPVVHAGPENRKVVRPCGFQRGSQEGALTAPEAADHIFRICAACLLGHERSSSPAAGVIPCIFRIMGTSAVTACTLQGISRVGPGGLSIIVL
jgi:hypothetical protein